MNLPAPLIVLNHHWSPERTRFIDVQAEIGLRIETGYSGTMRPISGNACNLSVSEIKAITEGHRALRVITRDEDDDVVKVVA